MAFQSHFHSRHFLPGSVLVVWEYKSIERHWLPWTALQPEEAHNKTGL